MLPFDAAHALAIDVVTVKNEGALADLLQEICAPRSRDFFCAEPSCRFLAHPQRGVRIHNYPEELGTLVRRAGSGPDRPDPPARASGRRRHFCGTMRRPWAPPRPEDERVRGEARRHGLADGLTMPAHLPGDAHGSVSFARREGGPDLADFPRRDDRSFRFRGGPPDCRTKARGNVLRDPPRPAARLHPLGSPGIYGRGNPEAAQRSRTLSPNMSKMPGANRRRADCRWRS